MHLRALMSADDLKHDVLAAITDRAFVGEDPLPRNAKEFENLKQRARTRLPVVRDAASRLIIPQKAASNWSTGRFHP